MSEIYIGDSVLIGYPADWGSRPVLRLAHQSQITTAPSGSEARGTQWHARRRHLRYQVTALDARIFRRVDETLRVAQEAMAAAVPYWHAMRVVLEVNGSTLRLSAPLGSILGRGQQVWWYQPEIDTYGTAEVQAASDDHVSLATVPEGLRAGAQIAPVLLGSIESVQESELNGAARSYVIDFAEAPGNASGTARELIEALHVGVVPSGLWENLSPEREAAEAPVECGVTVDGRYEAVVIAASATESAAVSYTVDGSYVQWAFGPSMAEAAVMGIAVSGSYL